MKNKSNKIPFLCIFLLFDQATVYFYPFYFAIPAAFLFKRSSLFLSNLILVITNCEADKGI